MLDDIKRHEGDNIGGVNSIEFIPANAFSGFPLIFEGAIHHEPILKPNYRWYQIYCTEFTMSLKETQSDSDHGAFFIKEIVGKLPKDREEITHQLNQLANQKLVIRLTYNNGTRKIVGNPLEPMYFRGNFDSKSEMAQRNEHDVLFRGEGIEKAPFYKL